MGGYGHAPNGFHSSPGRNGSTVMRRPGGGVAGFHDPGRGLDVHRNLGGGRTAIHEGPDHSRVVAYGHGRGFVQRPYSFHGHEYARRDFYGHGFYHGGFYGRYYFRGGYINPYFPRFYFGVGFYGWAYNPWAYPVGWGWGWGGAPWYGYYGPWFAPYPMYAGPAFWLTDYMIAASLQDAYQARMDAQAEAEGFPPLEAGQGLSPEVKDQIAEEVKRQIALENAEAQNGRTQEPDPASSSIQRSLTDGIKHVFIAGQNLDVVDSNGNECALSEGDALQLIPGGDPNASAVNLAVMASKGGRECGRGSVVSVNLPDLQEMQNHMRQTIDAGMLELQKKQGTGGLPPAPASALAPPNESVLALNAPPPPTDSEIASQIQQTYTSADQAEREALGGAPAPTSSLSPAPVYSAPVAPQGPPPTVTMGQTPAQVIGMLGRPTNVVDLGIKKIYIYPQMKVTFIGDRVTDVN
jgi:hypothetical protein